MTGHIYQHITTHGADTVAVPVQTATVNDGLMAAAGLFGHASLDIDAAGAFANDGAIIAARNGDVTLFFGASPGLAQVVPNSGLIEALPGGTIDITAANGSVLNTGLIDADGGTVDVGADVSQSGNGTMAVTHNGTLELDNRTSGGTIQINAGMLEIGNAQALSGFSSTLQFIGSSGTIAFDGAQNVTENYSNVFHSLVVDVDYGAGQSVHREIALPASGYSGANFATYGNEIVYTAHH